jgi:hypothetical protein
MRIFRDQHQERKPSKLREIKRQEYIIAIYFRVTKRQIRNLSSEGAAMSLGKVILLTAYVLVFCGSLQAGIFPYKYATVQVIVVDIETGEPIPKTKVAISYPGDYYFNHPKPDSATTDDQGVASLKIAKGPSRWNVSLDSKGYISTEMMDIGPSEPEISDQEKITLNLRKMPKVKVIVPSGYVGPLTIDLPKSPVTKVKSVSREEYVFHADVTGNIKFETSEFEENWTDLALVFGYSNFTAVYEDGREIPVARSGDVKDSTIAVRHVVQMTRFMKKQKTPQNNLLSDEEPNSRVREIYVLGTAKDLKEMLRSHPEFEENKEDDVDFDVHDFNWGATNAGFGSK